MKDLKSFLKTNIDSVIVYFTYPKSIIPRSHYVNPIDINSLNELDKYVILRRSDKSLDETFNEFNNLNADIIVEEELPGLSMNLLGGFYNIKHLKYQQTGKAGKPWDSVKEIRLVSYLKDIKLLKTYCPVYFLIHDLQNVEFPYNRPNDQTAKKLISALGIPNVGGKIATIQAKTEILHKPSNLNYWHVEFTIKESLHEEAKAVKDTKAKWKEDLAQSIYHLISAKAKKECPAVPNVTPNFYTE